MSQQPKQRMLVITSEMWDQVVSGNLLKLWPAAGATQRDTWLLIFNTHFNPTPPWTVEDLGWFVTQVRRPDVARPLEPVFVRVEYREDPAAAAAADSGGVPNGIVGNNLFFGTKDAAGAVKRLFHELGGGAVGPNGQRLSETCCLCSRDCDNGRHLRDHVHQARDGSFIVVDAPPAKRRKKLPPPAAVAVEEDEDEEDEGRDPVQRFVEHLDEETCEGMRQRLRVVEAEQALREKERGQKERGQKQQGGQNGRDAGNAGPNDRPAQGGYKGKNFNENYHNNKSQSQNNGGNKNGSNNNQDGNHQNNNNNRGNSNYQGNSNNNNGNGNGNGRRRKRS